MTFYHVIPAKVVRPVVAVLGHSVAMLMLTTIAVDFNFIVYSFANLDGL